MLGSFSLYFIVSLSSPAELIDRATSSVLEPSPSLIAAERVVALSTMGTLLEQTAIEMKLNSKNRPLTNAILKQLSASAVRFNSLRQVQNFLQQISQDDEVIQELALRQFLKTTMNQRSLAENAESMALKALYQAEVTRTLQLIQQTATQIKRLVIASKQTSNADASKVRSLLEQIELAEQTAQFR